MSQTPALSQTPARYRVSTAPSKLAFGAARLGAFWQGQSPRQALRTLEAALDAGIRVLDTADVYALGLSERVIGRVLRERGSDVVLCTKVGQLKTPVSKLYAERLAGTLSLGSLARALPRRTPADVSEVPRCFDSAYLRWAFTRSLARLGRPSVDILLLHSPTVADVQARRFEDAALAFLREGRALNFGISCDDAQVARAAAELPYVSFVELPVDVQSLRERALLEHLASRGIAVLARSPFGGGALIETLRTRLGRFDAELAACCLQAVTALPAVFSTIVGMGSAERVRENVALLSRPVSPALLREVERALHGAAEAST